MDFEGRHICLLTDQDLDSPEPLPAGDWPCDPRPWLPEAEWLVQPLEKLRAVAHVMEVSRQGFDVYVNLCDGAWDETRPGIEVVQTLERLGVPFTGGHSGFFEPSREAMKRACDAAGVEAPRYVEVRTDADVRRAAEILRFPLIVKHHSSYASTGLTPASRVETPEDLWTQVTLTRNRFSAALVEEFIEGEEYTVLVAENARDPETPITYRALGYRFPEGASFKHEALKWVDYDGLEAHPVEDPELDRRLREASARFFLAIGGSGYGRCDIRLDREGRIFMLEINPNCGIFYPPTDPASADLILQADPAGHRGFLLAILEAALARHARARAPWAVGPRAGGGFGLFATRSLAPDDLVFSLEGGAAELVARHRIEAIGDPEERLRRLRGVWPLTRELCLDRSRDPMGWRPLHHACEPSAWIVGSEVRVRTALAPGEEITVDYATLYDDLLPDHPCGCGAETCRGTVRGSDWRTDAVARYGDRVSAYVRQRRAADGLPPGVP